MARRAPSVNGVHLNSDVHPPSTLAAQIVENQSWYEAPPEDGGGTTFAELLHELLHNDAAVQETNVLVNVQLISVVAEAGLAPLAQDNPFIERDVHLAQAIDSIAVVERTIKRQPEVLVTPVKDDGPYLALLLLARLSAICGRPQCEELPVARLLDASLQALWASAELWQLANVLQHIIQVCVDDAISALESATTSAAMFSLTLPPGRLVGKLWPQAETAVALPQGYQTEITCTARAFVFALLVLQMSTLDSAWRKEAGRRLQQLLEPFRKRLKIANQWEHVLKKLMLMSHNLPSLCWICSNFEETRPSAQLQCLLAQALVNILQTDSARAEDYLLSPLQTIAANDAYTQLHEDLRIAIATWLWRFAPQIELPEQIIALGEALRQDDVMINGELQAAFKHLSVSQKADSSRPRSRKRRKLTTETPEGQKPDVVRRVTKLLVGIETEDLDAITELAPTVYKNLSEEQQCFAWHLLEELSWTHFQTTAQIMDRLVLLRDFQQSRRPRVLAMSAIRSCLSQTSDISLLDLHKSVLGKTCLSSLRSSLRELRIAAGRCLPVFLRDDVHCSMKFENRKATLEYLRHISDRNVACEQETLIGAWVQVGLVCGNEELNLVLLQLLDYLGHTNSLICAVAFAGIQELASAKQRTVEELLRPFWRTIAVSVVQDIHARPQKAQQLCDLLGVDVNKFLSMTQHDSIPTLVLMKKRDLLQRIAIVRGSGTSVQDICLQPRTNLTATLALLLSQDFPDPEEAAMECLTNVAPEFHGMNLTSLVKIDPVLVACEMLRYSSGLPDNKKSRAYRAFNAFANLAERTPGQSKASSKSGHTLVHFFDTHILGIMTHFAEVIGNTQDAYSTTDKSTCVGALTDMIALTKSHAGIALPQIRSCLQTAMEQSELVEPAFSAWLALISVLESDDIANMLDETFALVVHHWAAFSPDLQKVVHEKITILLRSHKQIVQDKIMTLPLLHGIPLLAKISIEIERFRAGETIENHCKGFSTRLRDESNPVVRQALKELVPWLTHHQDEIYDLAISEQPAAVLSDLLRSLLDAITRYAASPEAADLCAKALGVIGCLDPNRIEITHKKRQVLVLSNFDRANEVVEWVVAMFEDVLVNSFKSAANTRAQGFLAFVMQELLQFCKFNEAAALRPRASQEPSAQKLWLQMPEHVRITLTPFLTSRYTITSNAQSKAPDRPYPGFSIDQGYGAWLHSLVYDLMRKAKGDNPKMVFPLLARVIRGHDPAISEWILPYAVLNVVLGGTVAEVQGVAAELMAVLQCQAASGTQLETVKVCSQTVFAVLDYMTLWLQEKKKSLGETRTRAYPTGHSPNDFNESRDMAYIEELERFLSSIPAPAIAARAMECGAYARALFHLEKHIRQERALVPSPQITRSQEELYKSLHGLYALIDEPDGLEGLGAHLTFLTEEQLVTQHTKAGRWAAAQAWYEMQLSENTSDSKMQIGLLECLRETGQFTSLLQYADSFISSDPNVKGSEVLPYSLEAHWMTGDLAGLEKQLLSSSPCERNDFNFGVSKILVAAGGKGVGTVTDLIRDMRSTIAAGMTENGTSSLQACHDSLKRLHVLYELEVLSNCASSTTKSVLQSFEKRLAVLGSYNQDKQDVLGLRRVVMRLRKDTFQPVQAGSSWLTTARLARKAGNVHSAYNAVLRAYECGDRAAKLEEAKLLWHDGHQRQAIQALELAIKSDIFEEIDTRMEDHYESSERGRKTNMLAARAYVLLTKWLDASGQSQSKDMTTRYQSAAKNFQRWEKSHYYLGKHYNKLLEAEKALPKNKQTLQFLGGEITKLTIENLMRSLPFGNKYWHQSIPKIITLWLDLGSNTLYKDRSEDQALFDRRVKSLQQVHKQLQKYTERIPPYVFYTALPQLISRVPHAHPDVWKQLSNIVTRIALAHPSQALWSLFAVVTANDRVRAARGEALFDYLRDPKSSKTDSANVDIRLMISHGQRLAHGLLQASEAAVEQRTSHVSLAKDLGFSHKLAPSSLVVPVEATLSANLPLNADSGKIKKHRAFAFDKVTISSFADEVFVLSSLQRPKKLIARGSDGKLYGLLCKPKDDLRKDQRLMEFNGIINRALKRDSETSKRRLYIKTYAVTPLSEESGTIEWVEGIKPIRDILLGIYARKGIRPVYPQIKDILNEACSAPEKAHLFEERLLTIFPATLHEWFTETYSDPETWFAARLRYARSAAVMSMTGHVLGLGDRHGENILLEESTGGVFHVDFNCLFDKGLTFEKPELVPFRLTHNMVDAMGAYGYEGPFRKSCELTLGLLRQEKDTLMTVLETFLYDPTTDFVGKKKKMTAGVPGTPEEILDSVNTKLKGLLRGEAVPLSVQGYADALIREAVSSFNLASMYLGWCPFL